MNDVLSDIFTENIIERLRKSAADSLAADFRFRVLSLTHANAGCRDSAHEQQLYFETRERWNLWIAAAVSAGLFQQPHGSELRSRLTGIDPDGFRSALAECMTCWALSCELGLRIQPRPWGRDRRILEFAAETTEGEVLFEVKSPRFRGTVLFGSDPEESRALYSAVLAMRAALRAANRQFAPARRNILVLASPEIDRRQAMLSEQWPASLVRAFYGEHPVMTTRSDAGANQFSTEGNFLKQPGGVPRYTRISAVVGLQDLRFSARVQAAVLHNPCSRQGVDSSVFGDWMQFGPMNGKIRCFRVAARSILDNATS